MSFEGPNTYVKIQRCEVRTTGWARHHCPHNFCVGLSSAHTCVVIDEKHLNIWGGGATRQRRAFSILSVPVLLLYARSSHNNTSLIPKRSRPWRTIEFLLPWSCRVAPSSSAAAWIRVQNGGPRLNPDTICDKRLSPRAAHILASLREFQNLWQPTSKGLRIAKIRRLYDNINTELEKIGRQCV